MIARGLILLLFVTPLAAFPVPKEGRAKPVAGSTWTGPIRWTDFRLLTHVLAFEAGGKVTMTYTQIPGTTYTGTWKQDGEKLTFEFGGSWYEAKLDADQLNGTARNSSGMTATYSASRKVDP